jgi:hypothetical protein
MCRCFVVLPKERVPRRSRLNLGARLEITDTI